MKKTVLFTAILGMTIIGQAQNNFPAPSAAPYITLKSSASGTSGYGYMQFMGGSSRMGWMGFGSTGNNTLSFVNELGGDIYMGANVKIAGSVTTNRNGSFGTYNSSQVQGIWSIGNPYQINTTANSFGNQYGIGYAYNQTGGSPFASEHQIVFTNAGVVNAAIGLSGSGYFKGNVGIGITPSENTENYTLAVNGTIGAKAIKVETSITTWPDFVFKKAYELASLAEVENYIEANGHLKDIPSAEEVEAEGIDVAEMNANLLQKVEELTLYVIELNKEVEKLKAQ